MKLAETACAIFLSAVALGCGASGHSFQPVPPGPGQAMIYVYRPSQSYAGSGVGLDVNVDGKKIGTLKQNGYLYGTVNAGRHVISSRTETTSEVPFDAKVGRSYYIQGAVELGLIMGHPSLVVVPEEQGKLAILGTKYSGD